MKGSLLVLHGGGPTAVLNASLYGVIREAEKSAAVDHVYGARGGTGGLLREDFVDLGRIPKTELELLPGSPGSAIGSSRDVLGDDDYTRIVEILRRRNIRYLLCNGGNGTMDACGKICAAASGSGDFFVMGIPKTIDNDLALTDHSPGYGSAARFMAACTAETAADLAGLPIHIVIIEAQGRDAGWIAAASALAAESFGSGPDLVYLPERPFDEGAFLEDAERLIKEKSSGLIVVSEGLKNANGVPVVKPVFQTGRAVYYGDTGSHLANRIVEELGFKARSEKPGLLGRASIAWQSPVDRAEAVLAGELAVRSALAGESGKMIAFRRTGDAPYRMEPFLAELTDLALREKKVPPEFINEKGSHVTAAFIDWCRPLIGPLPRLIRL
jgi:6-phosphofructokinase 1